MTSEMKNDIRIGLPDNLVDLGEIGKISLPPAMNDKIRRSMRPEYRMDFSTLSR